MLMMNECNQNQENTPSSFLTRPTSLSLTTTASVQDVVSTPYHLKTKELEDILLKLKDSPSLKQALLTASANNSPDQISNQLSQVLNSSIDPNLLKAFSLAAASPSASPMTPNANPLKSNSSTNLLTSVGGQLLFQQQQHHQPQNPASNTDSSNPNIYTILNLCQQQQQNAMKSLNILDQNFQTAKSTPSGINQPQLILLASPNVSTFGTSQGQSFPISLAPQNTLMNLSTNKPNDLTASAINSLANNNNNQTNNLIKVDDEDLKKKSLKREISSADSMENINSSKSRRRKFSPNRLISTTSNGLYQDSSGCISPSGKTNCSVGSPKDGESNSSFTNNNCIDDPFEKSRLMRLEKKRARNRDAAKKCRERKLTLIRSLEVHVAQLVEDNKGLKARLMKSRSEVERLKTFVMEHLEKDCQFMNKINCKNNDLPSSPTTA